MAGEFEIPLSNHRRLFGVFLAAHAIPDAVDLMLTGVGCKPKAQRQIARHDRAREAGNKMVWADIGDAQLITGPAKRLREIAVETCRRRQNVGLVVVSTSAAMEMTGVDLAAALRGIRSETGVSVVHVPSAGWEGDFHRGYEAVTGAVIGLVPWRGMRGEPRTANLAGYLFDRYEGNHSANLHELRRLLGTIGITLNVTFLSGVPLPQLLEAPRASVNLLLPYAGRLRRRLASARPTMACALPVGLGATGRFLCDAATAVGTPREAALALHAREVCRTEPLLRIVRDGLAGRRAAVLADTPLAAGLCGLLVELGAVPVLAGLLDRSLGGAPAFSSALRACVRDPGSCTVICDPSARDVAGALASLSPIDLLLAPDIGLPQKVAGTARLEIGFPANRRHAVAPSPFMGYAGALSLAQRMLDAVNGVH